MAAEATIEKACTVTSKGQTTLPLAIRQMLGVPEGGKIIVRAEGSKVVLTPFEEEHADPAIGAFLALLAKDIAGGRNLSSLPDELAEILAGVLRETDVDLDEPIAGDVCL